MAQDPSLGGAAFTASNSSNRVRYLLPSMLPVGENVYFEEAAFFARGNVSLPSPAEVRQAAENSGTRNRSDPIEFHALGLVVKYGPSITIAEGQCLWALRRFLPSVPVPEVYGWCREQGETFIYMQRVEGITLEHVWPDLDVEDKIEVCQQLHEMLVDLRELKQDPNCPFIGNINQGSLKDVIFQLKQPSGPFKDVQAFNDWFTTIRNNGNMGQGGEQDPWRRGLIDDVPIVFTHADLHRSNIMISHDTDGTPRVAAILDWHQSGWYPAPWEFYKTRLTAKFPANDQWELEYITEFLQAYRGYIAWEYFLQGVIL